MFTRLFNVLALENRTYLNGWDGTKSSKHNILKRDDARQWDKIWPNFATLEILNFIL